MRASHGPIIAYGVTSERKLVEELRMHLAWRWFTGIGFDQEIPHHSTFSKNRHGRFHESNLFQELFEEIVGRCVEAGLVKGEHMSVDGSFIQAIPIITAAFPRAIGGGGQGKPHRARVFSRIGAGEPGRTSGSAARASLDHGPGFDLRDQRRVPRGPVTTTTIWSITSVA
jgi:hypothetical protein